MQQINGPLDRIPLVPKEYGGKWIAWDYDGTRIVASGTTLKEAREAAREAGCRNPRFEKVPPPNIRIVGRGR